MQSKNQRPMSLRRLRTTLIPVTIAAGILILANCITLTALTCPATADQGTTFWVKGNGSNGSGSWETPNSGGMSVMLPENMEVLECRITASPYSELVIDGGTQTLSYKSASAAIRPAVAGYQWWSYSTGSRNHSTGTWNCSLEVAVNDQAAGDYTLWFHGINWCGTNGTDVEFEQSRALEVIAVTKHDVGVSALTAPAGDEMWNDDVYPQVTVENFGDFTESFDVRVIITDGSYAEVYNETETVTDLASSDDLVVDFATAWSATPLGTYHVVAQTELSGDEESGNDMMEDDFDVVPNHDVGVTALTSPAGTIGENTEVYPKVTVENFGDVAEDFDVRVIITDGSYAEVYNETEAVSALGSSDDLVVDFATAWTATPQATYHVQAQTELSGDATPGNDMMEDDFDVGPPILHDVGATAILRPAGTVGENTVLYPKATVENFGEVPEDFDVRIIITDGSFAEVYNETEAVTALGVGEDIDVEFTVTWTATPQGSYHVEAQTELAGDATPGNDMTSDDFEVGPEGDPGWSQVAPMPNTPTDKAVKYGGWLALGPDATDDAEVIYAAKGYKTTDFYKYDPAVGDSGTWYTLADIPADEEYKPGKMKTKPGKKGCKGVSDGAEAVYMTRGANLSGFYRYDIGADTWGRVKDVPEGASGKRVKYGNDMVYVFTEDTGWIYLLKGYKTEFFRYNTVSGEWDTTLPEVPWKVAPKYKNGSFLVYDGDNTIYAHQANYYDKTLPEAEQHHSMFKYDVAGNAWDTVTGMPVYCLEKGKEDKRKKSKDGACGAWYDGNMYALKGGNTQGLYKYYPGEDSWTQLKQDTLPQYTLLTDKKRRVKHGADIVHFGDGIFYALKGNKTREMWKWFVRPDEVTAPNSPNVMAGKTELGTAKFQMFPNPIANGFATVRYSLPKAGPASITVFDVVGRAAHHQTVMAGRTGSVNLDLRKLANGVYLVRFDADSYTNTHKLVVQH